VPLGNGKNELELGPDDDFMTDNAYYVSVPERAGITVLTISNDPGVERSRVIPALQAAGDQFTKVSIEHAKPPKVPDLEHNVYLIKDVDTQFILPGLIKGLREDVEEGAVLVVMAQDTLFSLDWLDLLPVQARQGSPLGGRQEIAVNGSLTLMRGLSDIGQVDGGQLLRVQPADGSTVYASVATNDGQEPVIAAKRIGKGAVIYYGIKDQAKTDIDPQSYAILWGRIVDFSLVDPMALNVQTGVVLSGQGRIATPMGRMASPVLATQAGFYTVGEQTIAANLYGLHPGGTLETEGAARLESDIASPAQVGADDAQGTGAGDAQDVKVPKDLTPWLVIAGLCLLALELLYVKYRGDL
jgi:hypothetical protein